MGNVEQTVSTRNQSTAQYSTKRLFLFDNRFVEGVFKNTTSGSFDLKGGQLVVRDTSIVDGFKPATSQNLADVIGITAYEDSSTLSAGESKNINIGTKGTIESSALELPDGVTLSTTVGNKSLRDVLESLGFHLNEGTQEMTSPEN